MSTSDQIMLGTLKSAVELAEQLTSSLSMIHVVRENGSHYVNRSGVMNPDVVVNASLRLNPPIPDLRPEEISVKDGYPMYLDIYLLGGGEAVLHQESRRLFDDAAPLLNFPMLYIRDLDFVEAAYVPAHGITELGTHVSAYVDGEPTWRRFALGEVS